jgi:hypothetical protein
MKEIKLPSGAQLKITPSPFADAKALYQAVLEDLRVLPISAGTDMASLYRDLFCIGFSSKKIEACLWECFKRCTYNAGNGDLKIDKDTFEPVSARDDYWTVCMEVAKENIHPFAKSLYAEYGHILATLKGVPT